MLALFTDFLTSGANYFVMAGLGENLQELIKSIIGPIFLAIVGVISLVFLVQRQIMQFVIFIIIAILVAALIYVPDMIRGLGEGAGGEISWN
jgi:uncharacterized membrane protein